MRATWRAAVRSFAGEMRRAILSPKGLILLLVVFLAGMLLTRALSVPLKMNISDAGGGAIASPAAVAASFVLGLILLCLCLGLLPDGQPGANGVYWSHLCVWLQTVGLTMAGCLGIWLSPGCVLPVRMLAALTALTCAYNAALCGGHAVLCALRGRPAYGIRAGLAVVLALAITAVLWTKTPIQALQRRGECGIAAYNAGTQMVASLSPVLGWSVLWSGSETDFNLTMTTHTYQLWLGPSFVSVPEMWPERSGGPGLVAGLMLWGLTLSIAGDLARALNGRETLDTA